MSIQPVILCGGKGIRLQPLAIQIPKPMVLVNKIPFLEQLIKRLRFEVDQILLLVGYLGSQIEEYFRNGTKYGLNIDYAYENGFL
jgi:D-glycero-alpha-D-manno-heptose 1-phosphate guanylyltransferase